MRVKPGAFLPNLITIGNGVCGFAAIVKLLKVQVVPGQGTVLAENQHLFAAAAWLILLGMVFDVFDGQVARLSGRTSDLGAQLDSFCDLVTFGLAPALLVLRLNMRLEGAFWQHFVWFFCLAYFLGAVLRLARFNEENDHHVAAHLCFKGLPSPAAAGCLASLTLFYEYVMRFDKRELHFLANYVPQEQLQEAAAWIPLMLPLMAIVLGWTMISDRLEFAHVASQTLHRSQSFNSLAYLIFGAILVFIIPEILLPLIFLGYLVYTPSRRCLAWLSGKPRRVVAPDFDDEDDPQDGALDGAAGARGDGRDGSGPQHGLGSREEDLDARAERR